jgi:hypothetical protein
VDWSSITPAVVIAIGSLITAGCSFFLALFNYRRSNYAVVRIVEARSGWHTEAGRGSYHEFRVVIQNLGIPLQNIGMGLEFSPPDGFGWGTIPMKTKDGKVIREGLFAKGAITEFSFATDRFDVGDDRFIGSLTNLKSQRAQLTLHADLYSMWFRRLYDRRWWIKRRWNRFAWWVTWKLRRKVNTSRGTSGIKYLFQVPRFTSPGEGLLDFAERVRNSPSRPSNTSPRSPNGNL